MPDEGLLMAVHVMQGFQQHGPLSRTHSFLLFGNDMIQVSVVSLMTDSISAEQLMVIVLFVWPSDWFSNHRQTIDECSLIAALASLHLSTPASCWLAGVCSQQDAADDVLHMGYIGQAPITACIDMRSVTLSSLGMRAAASSKRCCDTRNSRYCPATCTY